MELSNIRIFAINIRKTNDSTIDNYCQVGNLISAQIKVDGISGLAV